MQKTAQKRSILNKLREKTNVSGIAAEKFFNPEFERVMNSLRAADSKARAIAAGTEIEGEDPGQDPVSLKELLKNAKSYLNRREYMTAIAFLGRFHKKMQEIVKVFQALNLDVDKVHHDFLFKDLDEDQKKHLHDLKSRLAAEENYYLVSEAGIMDFLVNVGTERGRALAAWEKRYPKQIGKLKKDLESLYNKSDLTLRSLLSTFKEMASFRANRKIDDYVKSAGKIGAQYAGYDKLFKDFYNSNVKGFLEKQELIAPTKTIEDKKDLGKQEVQVGKPAAPIPDLEVPESPFPLVQKESLPPGVVPPSGSSALAPPRVPSNLGPAVPSSPVPEVSEEENKTEPTNEIPPPPPSSSSAPPKLSHQKFWNSLEALSEEDPQFLAVYIKKYANSIRDKDPQTAIQLFKIAQSIRE